MQVGFQLAVAYLTPTDKLMTKQWWLKATTGLQQLMDNLNKVIRQCGMKTKVKKTKVMCISQKKTNEQKIFTDVQQVGDKVTIEHQQEWYGIVEFNVLPDTVQVKLLFNMINMSCGHGFVPDNFGHSVTVPVVKDKMKDLCSAGNYRPITLSPQK